MFTVPLVAVYFGYVSVLAPLCNILVLWIVPIAFALGIIAAALGFIWMSGAAAAAFTASLCARYVMGTAKLISRLDAACIYLTGALAVWFIISYAALLVLIIVKPGVRFAVYYTVVAVMTITAVSTFTALSADASGFALTALNVGQGECVVLTCGPYTAVVDCGSSSGEDAGDLAARYIGSLGRHSVDAIVLTHFHSDHTNGVTRLLSEMKVGTMIMAEPLDEDRENSDSIISLAEKRKADIIYLDEDASVTLGDMTLHLFAPGDAAADNDRCVCILAQYGTFEVLITGDGEELLERTISSSARLPDTEVLVVGHHGSNTSTTELLLDSARPDIAVISVGYNSYGHPSGDVLERLAARDVKIYRTDVDGNVTIRPEDLYDG